MMWNGRGDMQPQGENASHLAYANGRVYVQTNLGALAALDAYTGAVVVARYLSHGSSAEP